MVIGFNVALKKKLKISELQYMVIFLGLIVMSD
jgi:hypothetical protein